MIQKITLNKFYLFIGCLGLILLYRLIPHPPNFTPVIAMALYLPIFFGLWSIPFLLLAFAITDYFIGFHSLLIWTWGSLALVGLFSQYGKNILSRLFATFLGSIIFFIISNFGVWYSGGLYDHTLEGLIKCYIMALPFFTNTLLSTIIFALLIEFIIFSKNLNLFPQLFKKIR
jgi:hypothetical protein